MDDGIPIALEYSSDNAEITAQFNLNLLVRTNRELGGDFKLDRFRHKVIWNEVDSAVEMHFESLVPQTVLIGHQSFFLSQRRNHPHREFT